MATLSVGTSQAYTTIAAAAAASNAGDTINVQAGTYTNDFVTINHNLTLNAVGGTVTMAATEQPPNGKAIIDAGGAGVSVAINGFDLSGVTVPDGNGAGIRYEGGALSLTNVSLHDNQEGLLAGSDPNGSITISRSTIANNGVGDGYTHNIYVGDIASLTVQNSSITGAKVGHEIKSRAESTTITNNVIGDASSGNASYEIDLPNGGNAVIQGNVIDKGANAQNPNAISYGEEGSIHANSSLTVSGNTLLNDFASSSTRAVVNDTSVTASVSDNATYGWGALTSGLATAVGNTVLAVKPNLASLASSQLSSGTASSSGSAPPASTTSGTAAVTNTSATTTASGTTAATASSNPAPATPAVTAATVVAAGTAAATTSTDPGSHGFASGSSGIASMPAHLFHQPAAGSAAALIDQTASRTAHSILPAS